MKAKEWVGKFQVATTEDELVVVLDEYGMETAELMAARTQYSKDGSKLPAAQGAIAEQRNKFRAIRNSVPTLTEDHFEAAVTKALPEFRAMELAAKRRAEQKEKEGDQPEPAKQNNRNRGRFGGKGGRGGYNMSHGRPNGPRQEKPANGKPATQPQQPSKG